MKNLGVKNQRILPVILPFIVIIVLSLILGFTIINSQKSSTPLLLPNCVVDTKDKAVKIALPLSQTYAKENNRTITTIDSDVFYVYDRPCWQIMINFKAVKNHEHAFHDHPYGVYAYCVSIWADTGEIRSITEQSWM